MQRYLHYILRVLLVVGSCPQTAYEKKNNSKLPALFNALLRNVKDRTGQEKIVSDEQKQEVIPKALVITLFHFDFFVIGKHSLCFRFQSFCAFHFQRINRYKLHGILAASACSL